ncbi:MAG TPA: hypothetical protein VK766_07880 [Cytophagaceae bacterium]|jgi:hypothetical protein|nr:hypothetical protein [Cytophagaceae bacterium]
MNQPLLSQTESVLRQLTYAIDLLSHVDYKRPLENLSGSSIGQHVRHVIEFYQCLMHGLEEYVVNYDRRVRDKMIEESREFSIQCINKILFEIERADPPKLLTLEVAYDSENNISLSTTFERELVYNIEHTIHHMALIKIGMKEINSELTLPAEFGLATSTIRHQQQNHVYGNVFTQK